MWFVLRKDTHEVFAGETVRPPTGAYDPATFEVIYSELPLITGDIVDPAVACSRYLKVSDKFIAGDGIDSVTLEISDYGEDTTLDINGDQVMVPLVENLSQIEVVSDIPPENITIKGVVGPLAACSVRVYVR